MNNEQGDDMVGILSEFMTFYKKHRISLDQLHQAFHLCKFSKYDEQEWSHFIYTELMNNDEKDKINL